VRAVGFGLASVAALLRPAGAQVSGRLDGSLDSRYVWHGITRATGWTAQLSLAAGERVGLFSLEAGAVRHYELHHVGPADLTEAGVGAGHVGEDDLWGRFVWDPGPVRVHLGAMRHLFRGDPLTGVGPSWNTTEVYADITTPSSYLSSSLEAWVDVDRAPGTFLRGSWSVPILAWPFRPFVFPLVDWELGLNLRARPNPAQSPLFVNFTRQGITHAGAGLTLDVRPFDVPVVFALGVRGQLGFEDATRANGIRHPSDFIHWMWLGATLVLGGAAQELPP
jgi:hypothetical protein